MISIIDYGLGNVGSIYNMLHFVGIPAIISKDRKEIETADKLILPGVGSFDQAITLLNESGLKDLINEKVLLKHTPILGICLGMQIMTRGSEEGNLQGLGWFDSHCIKFKFSDNLNGEYKIPHMGWNDVIPKDTGQKILQPIDDEIKFYFAHSFHLTNAERDTLATANYGYNFAVAIKKDNILGVQFHPERSHMFGVQLFKAFSEL